MPVIECDPEDAREKLLAAGIEVGAGNTPHERWRATVDGAVAVAYEGKVVVQGSDPYALVGLLRESSARAHLYFDGACRGNPGQAAIGWVIVTDDGIVAEGGERIGKTTNNRAEYEALIRVLEVALDYGFDEVEVRGDSELIVKQVRGEYEVRNPELKARRVRTHELLAQFDDWSISHVPRAVNDRADELANEAFDD